jgi:hypothetical protein
MTYAESRAIACALKTAQACLSGQIGAIEACWALLSFVNSHQQLLSKDDRNLFVAIESEADALPVGRLKDNWHPDFLPAKLEQLKQYEDMVANDVRDACARLVVALEAAEVESR